MAVNCQKQAVLGLKLFKDKKAAIWQPGALDLKLSRFYVICLLQIQPHILTARVKIALASVVQVPIGLLSRYLSDM